MDALKLPMTFDSARLLDALLSVEQSISWHTHPDYTVAKPGAWTAVALIGPPGSGVQDARSLRYRGEKGVETDLLKASPYFQQVLEEFKTDIHRARLMNLKPGTDISPHRDYGHQRYSLERGFIRVHIPLRTHERVAFLINGNRIPMQPGEAWYTNVCEPHAVKNESDVHRVHLVLDMKVNDWVLAMFPEQSPLQRLRGVVLRNFERPYINARTAVVTGLVPLKRRLGDLGLRRLRDAMRPN